jgi:DNA invertase Pin-like site-specific DNA recombinase
MIESHIGKPSGMLGKTQTQETKNKIGEKSKGNTYSKGYKNHLGKTHSIETKIFIGNLQIKLTKEQVLEIRKLFKDGISYNELSKIFKVSRNTIMRADKGIRGYDRICPIQSI